MRPRGFVLPVTLFALVLLAALAAGALFESLQAARIGRNVALDASLRSLSESGIAATLAAWDPLSMDTLSTGHAMMVRGASADGATNDISVRRLNDRLMLVTSSAQSTSGVSRAAMAVVRLSGIEMNGAALRARAADPLAVARANGSDHVPPGWSCADAASDVAGADLQPAESDSTLFRFGRMSWSDVVAWAAAVPSGGDSLPVIYQAGDYAQSGGQFTGALIVAGDLRLEGGSRLTGLVIVRNRLLIGPGGAAIYGAVLASQVVVDQSVAPQELSFSWSSCAALRAGLSRASAASLAGLPNWGVF